MEPLLCSWLVLSSRLGVCILFEAFRELEFARLFIRMNFCPAGLACNFFTFSSIALRAISGTSLLTLDLGTGKYSTRLQRQVLHLLVALIFQSILVHLPLDDDDDLRT